MDYLKRISHVSYACKDFDAMERFYGEILGLRKVFSLNFTEEVAEYYAGVYRDFDKKAGDTWLAYYEVAPREYIELYNTGYNGENDTQNEGFHHVCLLVEDIVAAARELESKGISLWKGPVWINRPFEGAYPEDPIAAGCQGMSGCLAFYIQDPEGNEIELMQYTDDCLQVTCR